MVYTGTAPSSTLAVGDGLPAAWTQEVGLSLEALGSWTLFTPTLTQTVTLTKTVTYARYTQVQKTVQGQALLAITSGGTATSSIIVGLPVAAATSSSLAIGTFTYSTGSTNYTGTLQINTTTTALLIVTGSTNSFGINPAVTAANGHTISVGFNYEAA